MGMPIASYLPALSPPNDILASPFEYAPLQPRDIRLLRLKRGPPPTHLICGSLSSVSLDDRQIAYAALSYVWGDSSPVHKITIDGKAFAVAKNLYEFLVRASRSNDTIPIWIDAICIDQNNLEERGRQVKLMREVYKKADSVQIWLGEARDDSDLAFDLIRRLFPMLEGYGRPGKVLQFNQDPLTTPRSSAWLALGQLMDRPWFSRIWVVQEVALPKRANVVCGDRTEHWEIIESVVLNLIRHDFTEFAIPLDDRSERLPTHPVRHGWRMIHTIDETYKRIQAGETIRIETALRSFHSYQATDPRDKIYGILGIVTLPDGLAIEPNYDISTVTLYTWLTYCIIQKTCSLGLLSMAGIGWTRAIPGLPSWTPDYSNSAGEEWDLRTWAASKGEQLALNFGRALEEPEKLWLSGFILDTVARMGSAQTGRGALWDWFLEAKEQFCKASIDDDAFWQTLCANKRHEGDDGVRADELFFPYSMLYCFECYKSLYGGKKEYTQAEGYCAGIYQKAMARASLGRRFCETGKGLFGLVPHGAEADDVVCVVYGGNSPLLIRPIERSRGAEQKYQLVGTCYVHGIMDGEVFTMGLGKKRIALV